MMQLHSMYFSLFWNLESRDCSKIFNEFYSLCQSVNKGSYIKHCCMMFYVTSLVPTVPMLWMPKLNYIGITKRVGSRPTILLNISYIIFYDKLH